LYLSKLEIFGFKSFADKTTIEFGNGVSAIVGPNGSGKSNIVDALRWVLGEQGDKILRSGKREDIVFNGTKLRKPLSVAEVSLTIENNKNILPTEYSEVQIARRFYRSGETEYYLNGTRVRLKDIRELFIDTGIGPDAYSVIELKMVETILSDVKNERRKLFEEAAGIISYKHNRELTFNRLKIVHETLQRVNDVIREKQRNVNALERQAKRNEEAKIVSEELKALEMRVGRYEYYSLLSEMDRIKSSEESNMTLKEKLNLEIRENDVLLDNYRSELSELDIKLTEINQELTARKESINKLEKDILVLDEKIINLNKNISRLKSENNNLNTSLANNREKEIGLREKIKVLKNTIDISEISLNEKKQRLDSTIKIINDKKNEIFSIGKDLKESNLKVSANKSKYQESKINYENNLTQLENVSNHNEKHLLVIEKLQEEKNKFEAELRDRLSKLKESESIYRSNENDKDILSKNISKLEKVIAEKKIELQKKKTKIDSLKNVLETFEDYAEGIKFLLKENNTGNLKTVIDAIEVEDRFKTAIETALGEVSNYLIADDSREINNIISLLEDNMKGKVTFILNDRLNYKNENPYFFIEEEPEFINEKGVYGFAEKFLKYNDDRYIPLMRYILDEYIVVDTKETAYRLSSGNYYKFVTLGGDIITEGFIRAGSEVKEESLKLGRKNMIEQLEKEASLFTAELNETVKELEKLTEQHDKVNLDAFKNDFDNFRGECDKLEKEISRIDFKKDELNKIIAVNESHYREISEKNKILNSKINVLIEEVNKSENEQYNLDKELSFLTEELTEIEKKFSEVSQDYNSFNVEVLKINNELKSEEDSLNRILNSVSYQEKQVALNKEELVKDQLLLDEIVNQLSGNKNKLTALKDEESIISKKFEEQKKINDEKKNLQHNIDLEQRQRRSDFDRVSRNLIDSQIKIKENEIKAGQVHDFILKKYETDITHKPEDKMNAPPSENIYPFNEFPDFDLYTEKRNVEELEERLKKLGGGYQQFLFEDYQNEKEELEKLVAQKEDLLESEKDLKKTIELINKEARQRFLTTLEQIRNNFIMIFKQLFTEGDEANLKLIYEEDDSDQGGGKIDEDPLEAKIEITAKPRGKRPTSIELLSGGEKTLTAIALLFAIYLVKPSPFCVLDEVDAPLDAANLLRFNNMIRKFSGNTQFILITHNERTMETVDKLYGVTMQEPGVTTIVETVFKND
jgi:chromosome segregation protein